MEKIELQEIIDACEEAKSDYLKLYRPLLGYEDNVSFNRGIDDGLENILNEIEAKVGVEFPADFLQIYLISNGGKYFDINLYYLTNDKEDQNGLYYKNITSGVREEYNLPENTLIIGETTANEIVFIGIDEEEYYYYGTWDKETKELDMEYGYLIEMLAYEIDYHTDAFGKDDTETVEE